MFFEKLLLIFIFRSATPSYGTTPFNANFQWLWVTRREFLPGVKFCGVITPKDSKHDPNWGLHNQTDARPRSSWAQKTRAWAEPWCRPCPSTLFCLWRYGPSPHALWGRGLFFLPRLFSPIRGQSLPLWMSRRGKLDYHLTILSPLQGYYVDKILSFFWPPTYPPALTISMV